MIWIFLVLIGILLLIGYCILRVGKVSDDMNDYLLRQLMKQNGEDNDT